MKNCHYQFIVSSNSKDHIVVRKYWRTIFYIAFVLSIVLEVCAYFNYLRYRFYKQQYEEWVAVTTTRTS